MSGAMSDASERVLAELREHLTWRSDAAPPRFTEQVLLRLFESLGTDLEAEDDLLHLVLMARRAGEHAGELKEASRGDRRVAAALGLGEA